ncbi:MAG: peptidylprolyl isomerase [Acidobacteria bacterium]|jgi:peptidyl-prolyl cis-trans isomerase A (cyclophilin A)|nr:peptidylprolyl isomerase [Acidobacteriota bacterium]
MKLRSPLLLALVVALAGTACGRREKESPSPSPTVAVATPTPVPTPRPPLLDPEQATEQAPDRFRVRFETTKGPFVVEVHRAWAPRGADRFYNLVRLGYYDDVTFFRVVEDFMVQFGIHGDPKVGSVWRFAQIPDDPVKQSNTRGMVTFATAGPGTRTTQVFINYKDNSPLDRQGFAPFGRVVEGMAVVDKLYSGYGDGPPYGPDQGRAHSEGNRYFRGDFPKLDHIKSAELVAPEKKAS